MSGHTPGPWRESVSAATVESLSKVIPVAKIHKPDRSELDRIGDGCWTADEVRRANARLIAAAPDLLLLLHEARGLVAALAAQVVTHDHVYRPLVERIDAAVAKVEGRA